MELRSTVRREVELRGTVRREVELRAVIASREVELRGTVRREVELRGTVRCEVELRSTHVGAGEVRVRSAFTIVELIVVVLIIAVVLGLGLPAFNAMSAQSRLAKTQQILNGTLLRANVIAVADRNMTAVRFSPAAWEQSQGEENQSAVEATGAQVVTTYRYAASSLNPVAPSNSNAPMPALFHERFERIKNGPSTVLPADLWVAPSEALVSRNTAISNLNVQSCRDTILQGEIGRFELNANANDVDLYGRDGPATNERLLDADDFLVIFDPENGVRSSNHRTPWRMNAHDPRPDANGRTRETSGDWTNTGFGLTLTKPFQRFNYTGVILYPREQFKALGVDAATDPQLEARRTVLSRLGRKFYVNQGGGLVGVQ